MADETQSEGELRRMLDLQRKLNQASYALHTTLDLDELLGTILRVAAEGVDADRGTVFLLTPDRESLWSRVLSGDEALEIRLPIGKGIAGAVAESGNVIRIDDAYEDERFDQSWDKKSGFRTRQILCAPIRNRAGDIVGVFQLLNKRNGNFNDLDEDYLASLSIHAALAVENARLHASAIEKERYDREVRLAQGVQRKLQPEKRTAQSGIVAAAAINQLCEDATGDYYDFVHDLPGDRMAIAIGDVSGHGLQAALVMAETRAFLRAFLRTAESLTEAMNLLNDYLVPDMDGGKFISLFCAVIDPRNGHVEWCNAGHNPPYLYRSMTGEIVPLKATGRILGILEDAGYKAGEPVALEEGDVLLLYTDGVTEARNPAHDLYGEERLAACLQQCAMYEPEEILDAVRVEVETWTEHGAREDDITMVAVKRVAFA